ncbi:nuclear transport factor 2 family protein [Streptomyces cyaneofuscatus]|uniref:nuclear transport factor 2 family protein n=1 Tax=Streptomyces cyaneofuscatus TaxID=66883 RepID=UPI003667CE19
MSPGCWPACSPSSARRCSLRTDRRPLPLGRAVTFLRPTEAYAGLTPTGRSGGASSLAGPGAAFELEELEAAAGEDLAFAHALVRCGTEDELRAHPELRMRLTLGPRKEAGRWVVAQEHHSFPDLSNAGAETEVRAVPCTTTGSTRPPGGAGFVRIRGHRAAISQRRRHH